MLPCENWQLVAKIYDTANAQRRSGLIRNGGISPLKKATFGELLTDDY
ncbi:MAG: hypothetical protein H6Q14_709 [Bacteroidetes bacterium]|nr:hypothetical protein [Bacteroidota bacterium]